MARIVLAMGTSHSPMLGSPAEDYLSHADRDKVNPNLLDRDGNPTGYDRMVEQAPDLSAELTPEVIEARVAACRAGMARLADTLAAAELDSLIIVGDDQREQYLDDLMPAVLIYAGETITNTVSPLPEDAAPYWRRARAQFHEEAGPNTYPVDAALAGHLVSSLIAAEFDVGRSTALPREGGEGHAFGFVHRGMMRGNPIPVVPLVLNTYFPPNQPTPKRCYDLGRAVARAVADWPEDKRVGVVASGGLSHFTVDEELDRGILDAIARKDAEALRAVPRNKLNSGNSEIRNWIAMAGAAEALDQQWADYVPCYRSPAGTGCGMAFGLWG